MIRKNYFCYFSYIYKQIFENNFSLEEEILKVKRLRNTRRGGARDIDISFIQSPNINF